MFSKNSPNSYYIILYGGKLKTVEASERYNNSIIGLTSLPIAPGPPALHVAAALTVPWEAVNF